MTGRNKLIEQILSGQPEYRIKQARNCLYKRLIGDWTQAYTLPLEIRDKLKAAVPLDIKGETIIMPEAIKAILEMRGRLKN
ncbi:MAG: hypothetical protein U5N58_01330 [Actinomycetota bacterium]|nr:hypothetical protein [Actinomycetota bacterium]